MRQLLGYAPEELIGTNAFDLIHPEDVATTQQVFARILAALGASETAEYRLRRENGSWRWCEGTSTNLLDDPSVEAIVGSFHDVTDRHEAVDVAALVTATVEQAQATTDTHTLRMEIPARLPTAQWDADRIIQALRNLLSNAIKYTPAGGEIVVRVQGMGDAVQIAVTDQGIGIPDEAMRRLFVPFYRAENAQVEARGMGLGLTVSKGFVEAHGGHIGVASVVGEGSAFTVILPYRDG